VLVLVRMGTVVGLGLLLLLLLVRLGLRLRLRFERHQTHRIGCSRAIAARPSAAASAAASPFALCNGFCPAGLGGACASRRINVPPLTKPSPQPPPLDLLDGEA